MKSVILVKQHPCIQLAHLYEHLFMRAVNEFFYEKGLYKIIDYDARGITFDEGGIIIADIVLYNADSMVHASQLAELRIDFGDGNVNISKELMKILAEEPWQLYVADDAAVMSELHKLDEMQWQLIDDLEVIDSRTIRRKSAPMYLTDKHQTKPRILSITLKAGGDLDSLSAGLFSLAARIALFTVSGKISYHYGLYDGELKNTVQKPSVKSELLVASMVASNVDAVQVVEFSLKVLNEMFDRKTCERIAKDLNTTNYANQSHVAPSYERILQQSGVLVGAKGWQQITWKDVHDVLNGATIEVKYGRTKEEVTLKLK